jgi:exonuclease SbcC
MLKKLTIENYQSHKKTEILLHPHINVIVGQSDSGKSAILRSLYWLIENKPRGFSFKSSFADEKELTKSSIELGPVRISRQRNNSVNQYIVEGVDGSISDYDPGTSVPDDISNIFNFGDVNIQKQIDPPFMISWTGGDIAKYLNDIVHLDKIDKVLKLTESKKRSAKKDIEHTEKNIEKELEVIESNKWSLEAKEQIKIIKEQSIEIEAIEEQLSKLVSSINTYESISNSLKDTAYIYKALEQLKEVEHIEGLLFIVKENISKLDSEIEKVQEFNSEVADFHIDSILDQIEIINKLENKIEKYNKNSQKIENNIIKVQELDEKIVKVSKNIKKLEKEMPTVCPTCGQEIKE